VTSRIAATRSRILAAGANQPFFAGQVTKPFAKRLAHLARLQIKPFFIEVRVNQCQPTIALKLVYIVRAIPIEETLAIALPPFCLCA